MLTTGNQLKAARALIDMDQSELSKLADVNVNTIRNMESAGAAQISGRAQNVQNVQRVLEDAGIEFLNHGRPGTRLRPLRVGDAVRMRKGTSLWGQSQDIKDDIGLVTAIVNDGTSMHRVTVSFNGAERFTGMDAGQFEIARPGVANP